MDQVVIWFQECGYGVIKTKIHNYRHDVSLVMWHHCSWLGWDVLGFPYRSGDRKWDTSLRLDVMLTFLLLHQVCTSICDDGCENVRIRLLFKREIEPESPLSKPTCCRWHGRSNNLWVSQGTRVVLKVQVVLATYGDDKPWANQNYDPLSNSKTAFTIYEKNSLWTNHRTWDNFACIEYLTYC